MRIKRVALIHQELTQLQQLQLTQSENAQLVTNCDRLGESFHRVGLNEFVGAPLAGALDLNAQSDREKLGIVPDPNRGRDQGRAPARDAPTKTYIDPDQEIVATLSQLQAKNIPSPQLFLKDPYLLDFLDLKDNFTEKDLESAILVELERFILEMGSDFAFMSRQKRIQVGGNDYYIDLLFYHRKLKRLVLIELKLGDFKPEYKGQVELYLKWLAKYEQQTDEQSPIAIVLCSGKDADVVELIDLEPDNIHIAEYWLQLPPKEMLQAKLHKALTEAKARIAFQRKEDCDE